MRELLLCPPDYYGIEYEINPWMNRARAGQLCQKQWKQLHARLSDLDCEVHLISPQPGLPDMVFTANAGLTVGANLSPVIFAIRSARASSRSSRNGWNNATMK
ncbi:MAG: hypothetical protein Udaeo2_31890 [Candidatus Udaeobacter sp.]|nr:MAG: hypothetical protein Udaeo2_31890 [Candidatus Udaeobacter sp.]